MPCDCPHPEAPEFGRVCRHMLAGEVPSYLEHFTGRGKESWLACRGCAEGGPQLGACAECWARIRGEGDCAGVAGRPGVIERASTLWFAHEIRPLPGPNYTALHPLDRADTQRYVGLTSAGALYLVDLDAQTAECIGSPSLSVVHFSNRGQLVSGDGRFVACFDRQGRHGAVVEVATGRVTMRLDRGDYFVRNRAWSLAFFTHRGRTLLVHATDWNRLDVSDPATAELLTPREHPPTEERPPHYLDYFHCSLAVSPDGRWVADDGWAWSPVGVVRAWSLERWLEENVWESEDGPSARELCARDEWDQSLCWLDERRLAVWGYGSTEGELAPAARLFEVEQGREAGWFPLGGRGELVFDEWLMCLGESSVDVYDADAGERLLHEGGFNQAIYHPGTRSLLSLLPFPNERQVRISRIVGRPVSPWLSAEARRLAVAIAGGRDWAGLPVLADALEEAGCDDARVLGHLREAGPHGNDCWAVRRLLDG